MNTQTKNKFMARYGSAEHLHGMIRDGSIESMMYHAAKNPALDKSHIDACITHPEQEIRKNAATHLWKRMDDHHREALLNDESNAVKFTALRSKHDDKNADQLMQIIHDPATSPLEARAAFVVGHGSLLFTPAHFKKLSTHNIPAIKTMATGEVEQEERRLKRIAQLSQK